MQNGRNPAVEALTSKQFPPLPPRTNHHPFIVVDKTGVIGLWHLPFAISSRLQKILLAAAARLRSVAPGLLKVGNGPAYRCARELFKTDTESRLGMGVACLSYCWFQLGHEVRSVDSASAGFAVPHTWTGYRGLAGAIGLVSQAQIGSSRVPRGD